MNSEHDSRYRPIADYAVIGDSHTAAFVARDGSIDWCCLPYFDSPAVFCRLLDAEKGGFFRVGPRGDFTTSRSYVGDTNVLATTFSTGSGSARVTDFMPAPARVGERGKGGGMRLVRLVEGLEGVVDLEVDFRPTFDFARATAIVRPLSGGAVAEGDGEALLLTCAIPLEQAGPDRVVGRFQVRADERIWMALRYVPAASDERHSLDAPPLTDLDRVLNGTLDHWRRWSERCTYKGPYHELVRRSALVLKLLTFEPTGGLVAAPTTSLPEEVGGVRNWDYRFAWLRDSSLLLYALMTVGYHDEAYRFYDWLSSIGIKRDGDPRIAYTIHGHPELAEHTLDHLDGYRGSRPVRVGNAAAGQSQLDVYGDVLDAVYFCAEETGPPQPEFWELLTFLADRAAERWQEPGHGIWEVRGLPRHFLHSKLLCWVALDRAIRLAERMGLPGDVSGWKRTGREIRNAILSEGYDRKIGAFTQVFGEPALDASALAIPLVGFLPATDPHVRSTMAQIREQLTEHGLVHRYRADDALPGSDATFALCSFWLVDNLALTGELAEARKLFERIVSYANDLGLLAEEIHPVTGQLLGNYPQGFSHLALIRSAVNIAKAEAEGSERRAETPAQRSAEARRTANGRSKAKRAGKDKTAG